MGWESKLEESGFRELGSDCEHLTKEFGLYSWVSIIQWWFPPPPPVVVTEWIQSGLFSRKTFLQACGGWNEEERDGR